jgi:hypothetical protein
MKNDHFYSHLIELTSLTIEIAELEVDSKERVHLIALAKANIHSAVVFDVLSSLSEEDKRLFLKNLSEDNHNKVWEHLKSKIENIEEKIKQIIEKIINELIEDIRETKKLRD